MVLRGEITDSLTVIAVLHAARLRGLCSGLSIGDLPCAFGISLWRYELA
jgi:hypothetical protein